jgi:protein-disulfide isomerase
VARLVREGSGGDYTIEHHLYRGRYGPLERATFDLAQAPRVGTEPAATVLVEFVDYSCHVCREVDELVGQARARLPGKTALYVKQFPAAHRRASELSARAAIAAHRQGKFAQMHHALLHHPGIGGTSDLIATARSLGLDLARFQADLDAVEVAQHIERDQAEGRAAHVESGPHLFINGRTFSDARDVSALVDWLEEEIALAAGPAPNGPSGPSGPGEPGGS